MKLLIQLSYNLQDFLHLYISFLWRALTNCTRTRVAIIHKLNSLLITSSALPFLRFSILPQSSKHTICNVLCYLFSCLLVMSNKYQLLFGLAVHYLNSWLVSICSHAISVDIANCAIRRSSTISSLSGLPLRSLSVTGWRRNKSRRDRTLVSWT
jgi:hypothetical protein